MKYWNLVTKTLGLAAVIAVAIAACNDVPQPSQPLQPGVAPSPVGCSTSPVSISIPKNAATLDTKAFGENPLTIPVGTMVTWTNNDDTAHSILADDGSFSSGTLNPGENFQHMFDTEGDFPYYDPIFGQPAMSGDIKVVALPAACSSPSPGPSESPSPGPSPSESPSPGPSPSESPSPGPSPSEAPSPGPSPSVSPSPGMFL